MIMNIRGNFKIAETDEMYTSDYILLVDMFTQFKKSEEEIRKSSRR